MEILLVYLSLINAAAFLLMLTDKQKARKKKWRIPERVLLGTAALGGSLGAFAAMHIFHHKTLHKRFSIGLPLMLVLHTAILLWLIKIITCP